MPDDDVGPRQSVSGNANVQVGGDVTLNVQQPFAPKRAVPVHVLRVIQKLDEVIDEAEQHLGNYGDPADIERKLVYNNVQRFEDFIRDYGTYGHAVEGAYSAVDGASPRIRLRVTRFIRSLYHRIAASDNTLSSDDILEMLVSRLNDRVADVEMPAEEVEPCCSMLVAHAFIGCTVLKTPAANVDS